VISANVGVRKPNPHIFKIVLDYWQLPPDRVVMVGDMLGADILGAHNVGMRGVWATMQTEREANAAHVHTVVPDASIPPSRNCRRSWEMVSGRHSQNQSLSE
jgi:putative hydrolase of the HAD superfamily